MLYAQNPRITISNLQSEQCLSYLTFDRKQHSTVKFFQSDYRGTGYRPPPSNGEIAPRLPAAPPPPPVLLLPLRLTGNSKSGFPVRNCI